MMRVSTDEDDPGYINFNCYYNVTVDGLEVREVVTADEELGYVLKAVQPFQVVDDEIVLEVLYGDVVITKLTKELYGQPT